MGATGSDGAKTEGTASAGRLARRLAAIPETSMRRLSLARFIADTEPGQVVETLLQLLVATRVQPSAAIEAVVELLTHALSESEVITYEVRCAVYEAAKRAHCEEIACLLFEAESARDDSDDAAAPRPLTPRGRPLSLGERKSLARGQRREVLTALLRDPHADVLAILLRNPHITEQDVVQVAARRPAAAGALEVVAASERWLARYGVRIALVRNPQTPPYLAVRIVASLTTPDLQSIADDGQLSETVREQAKRLLRYMRRTVH